MTFTITPQRYELHGHAPLTYAIHITDYPHEHDDCWGAEGFVAYSRTVEGAATAIQLLKETVWDANETL